MSEKSANEKRTLWVILLTVFAMAVEISVGLLSGSMALLADGVHMSTHAFALGLTLAAYFFIRKYENSPAFKNGTDKIGELAGFSSSLLLGATAIAVLTESVARLFCPREIMFDEAIVVAVVGLLVNALCLAVMGGGHLHIHGGKIEVHSHGHGGEGRDNNFLSAYFHILADALTSVFAIVALLAAKYFGWHFFDSIVGVLGGVLILKWALGLVKSTSLKLLDVDAEAVRQSS